MPKKTSNITLKEWRAFLTSIGCNQNKGNGGHEKWTRKDLLRPIMFQTHVDPIPEFIILNNLRNLGLTKKDLLKFFD